MAKGELTVEYGIKECSKCEYFLRCEECTHSETATDDLMIFIRKGTANEFYNKVNENICSFKLENKSQEFIDGYAQAIADICGRLDQVAKQFGVEV